MNQRLKRPPGASRRKSHMKGAVTLVFGSAFLAISASPRTKVVMLPSQTSRIRWSMLSGESIFTKRACISDAPVIDIPRLEDRLDQTGSAIKHVGGARQHARDVQSFACLSFAIVSA